MALVLYDRVQQTGTANTTVSFTLSGSVTGYQSFSVVGNTNTTYYGATDTSGNWEVGLGTYSTTGPTLTRTTILSSSNAGAAVTFSGTVTVFVTYPSSTSIYEDASGNVSPLGTIASGTWQGSTVGVAYGGTGVTASSGANSVMLRDANQNVAVNRLNQSNTSTAAAAGTTVLTAASSYSQTLTGTGTQTYRMPDATTLTTGVAFVFNNNATGTLTLQDYATGSIGTITPGGAVELVLLSNGTTAGTWDVHGYLPEAVTWGTNALALGSTVITGGTWNGGTIPTGYGGTGLTTFTAANNALYSTSASALAAGTLPIAAGGTAGTTAATAFNNLNPMTTTGDIIYEASAGTAARLPVGSTGQILTVAGGIPSWAANAGSTTLTTTSFTATSGQTTFTVTYTPALLQGVYRNGIKLDPADYTATNGTTVVLATGATLNDNIQVQYFSSLSTTTAVNTISFGSTGLTPSTATAGAVTVAGTLGLANGGTASTTAPQANATLRGWTTTATAVGTTTLTNTSSHQQEFTGTTTQTVVLPVTSTLALGWSFEIINNSTGSLTIQSSGLNTIGTLTAGTTASLVCILTSGTTAASWDFDIDGFASDTGTGAVVRASSPTLVTPALGTPSSGTVTNLTGTASININGTVGATTPSTVTATQLTVNGSNLNTTISPTGTGTVTISPAGALTINPTAASTINNASIGATTASTGRFTTVTSTVATGTAPFTVASTTQVANLNAATAGTAAGLSATLVVGSGGTGLTGGTSGGIPYFSGASTIASSAALTQYGVVYGGGAGATPVATAAGTTGQVLTATTGAAPTWASPAASGATITPTTTAGTYYIVGTTSTSGTLSTASISNTNAVSYNANTGALTAVSVVSSSDERLKTNIQTLTNAVQTVENLRGVSYLRNDRPEIGVIAQEVEKILPMLVHEDPEGYKSVAYGNMVGLLIEAVKELSAEVKALKAELNK